MDNDLSLQYCNTDLSLMYQSKIWKQAGGNSNMNVVCMGKAIIKLASQESCLHNEESLYLLMWFYIEAHSEHIDDLAQDNGNSSAIAMEWPQSCAKPSIFSYNLPSASSGWGILVGGKSGGSTYSSGDHVV